jgi:hypothetical protein
MRYLFYFLPLVFLLNSCDENDSDPVLTASEESLINAVQNGAWRITLFVEDGEDETSDYSGIRLNFLPDGKLNAANNGQAFLQGSWKTLRDDGQTELWITFVGNEKLEEISDDWYVISATDVKIELEDDNDQFIDKLTLTRE